MKFHLNLVTLGTSIQSSQVTRDPTSNERIQVSRIMRALERPESDSNIEDYFLQGDLSPKAIFYLLSSGCPQVIELTLLLLAIQGGGNINPEHEYSLLLGILHLEPRLFPILLEYKGWKYQNDVSDVLRDIRIKYRWKRRPRAKERIRGYRDHGTLPDEQHRLRQACLSKYYVEQFEQLSRTDREVHDTLAILEGYLS